MNTHLTSINAAWRMVRRSTGGFYQLKPQPDVTVHFDRVAYFMLETGGVTRLDARGLLSALREAAALHGYTFDV